MKLEVGKYYRTRDGRKVGPMVFSPEYETYAWDDGSETGWTVSGLLWQHGERDGDLIAEWTDTPEVGTLKEIGAQVGDVVETGCGWQQVITKIEGESYFGCGRMGYVHDISSNPDSPLHKTWRIVSRAQPGPVRTVTRQEIVPGCMGGIVVDWQGGIRMDATQDADELTAAIATLTAIRDAMQADTTA